MRKKEILFISNFMGNGGAARVITLLAESFADKGYDVTICSFPFNDKEYPHSRRVNYVLLEPNSASGIKHRIERIRILRKEIKHHLGATIISFEYFMNMQTIVAAWGLKKQLIISERNDPAKVGGYFPMNILRNFLYLFCDALVCQTPDAKEYFPKSIRKKATIIANPIKEDLPQPWEGEREHVVVNFCRLQKQKNIPLLIDAFEEFNNKYSDYKLFIYGDGSEQASILQYIKNKNLDEVINVYPAIANIHEVVLKSAMFVSVSDYEGLSNSMIEAMAIGIPTICTDCPCGGAKMIIKDQFNGLLVPVNNKDALYKAMCKVVQNDKFARSIARNAMSIKEQLNVNTICDQWLVIINN